MGRNLFTLLLGIFNIVNSAIVNNSTILGMTSEESTVVADLLSSSSSVVSSSVNGTTMVDVTGVNSTVGTDLLSSISTGVSSYQNSTVIVVLFYMDFLFFFLMGLLLCFLCYEELKRCRNNENNSEIIRYSDDSAYNSMLGLGYDSSSIDSVGSGDLSSGNSNVGSLGSDERNSNGLDDDNGVLHGSSNNVSALSSGSFASLRYSSESETEGSNQEVDQSKDSSKNNSLKENKEVSVGLQEYYCIDVGNGILETRL